MLGLRRRVRFAVIGRVLRASSRAILGPLTNRLNMAYGIDRGPDGVLDTPLFR